MSRYQSIQIPEEQIARLERGDRPALAMVYQALSGVVYSMALRILGDPQAASGVTQDTFLTIMEKIGALSDRSAFVGWVRRIAMNHCLMRLRASKDQNGRRHVSYPDQEAGHAPFQQFDENSAVDGLSSERMDGLSDIERALNTLVPETRMVVWLHEVEGLTHREIGQLFGRSQSFSKSQLARGYAQLKKTFHGEKDDEGTQPRQQNETA